MKKIKIKSIALPEFVGKTLQEVYDYAKKEYPNQLPYDGIDFYDNECLKDGNWHYFFGSVFRDGLGDWSVPCAIWFGSGFRRFNHWLSISWNSDYRLVLLEILPVDLDHSELTLESLNLRLKKLEKKKK